MFPIIPTYSYNYFRLNGVAWNELGLCEGCVLYRGPPAVRTLAAFAAVIHTSANLTVPILPGSTYEMYIHGQEVSVYFTDNTSFLFININSIHVCMRIYVLIYSIRQRLKS